jgi:hypothetical protein
MRTGSQMIIRHPPDGRRYPESPNRDGSASIFLTPIHFLPHVADFIKMAKNKRNFVSKSNWKPLTIAIIYSKIGSGPNNFCFFPFNWVAGLNFQGALLNVD